MSISVYSVRNTLGTSMLAVEGLSSSYFLAAQRRCKAAATRQQCQPLNERSGWSALAALMLRIHHKAGEQADIRQHTAQLDLSINSATKTAAYP
jgi:hypothetical protein